MEATRKFVKLLGKKKGSSKTNPFNSSEILTHEKYFAGRSISQFGIVLNILLLVLGLSILLAVVKKDSPGDILLVMLALSVLAKSLLWIGSYVWSANILKGIPINPEKDLVPNVHYVVKRVLSELNLCQLGIKYPQVSSHQLPLVDGTMIMEAAKSQGVCFAQELTFFIREDGTFVFVHPVPTNNDS